MTGDFITLDKQDDVFILTMDAHENQWSTSFTREFAAAIDEVESSEGPAALVSVSANDKFYSNGMDLAWIMSGDADHPGGDRKAFGAEFMGLAGRLITLPVPTIAAVNGHAFGAGFMIALAHDVRIMRQDRGYMCANEVELGMTIPEPELALFRHKMPMHAFYETVQFAKRWSGPDAHATGFVQEVCSLEEIRERAITIGQERAHLARHRDVFGWQKEHIWGANAAINNTDGPAHLLKNSREYASGPNHMGE